MYLFSRNVKANPVYKHWNELEDWRGGTWCPQSCLSGVWSSLTFPVYVLNRLRSPSFRSGAVNLWDWEVILKDEGVEEVLGPGGKGLVAVFRSASAPDRGSMLSSGDVGSRVRPEEPSEVCKVLNTVNSLGSSTSNETPPGGEEQPLIWFLWGRRRRLSRLLGSRRAAPKYLCDEDEHINDWRAAEAACFRAKLLIHTQTDKYFFK